MEDKAHSRNEKIRNIAIIAHVDHGKTTLVDQMLRQSGLFREGQQVADRIMDSMELERERGITIAAKNCSFTWKDIKINVLDTPGHADFGGEVERALSMVDGAILLVDAAEGPLPQTRFVLRKALEAGLALIVVINKIDRKDARPQEVLNAVYDLFIDLDAREEQLDFPVIYAIGREGVARRTLEGTETGLGVLYDTILSAVPPPSFSPDAPFQMLVGNLGFSEYVGRIAVGKVMNGRAHENESLVCIKADGSIKPLRVTRLQEYSGVGIRQVSEVFAGDIALLAGIEDVEIGDTVATKEAPRALKRITVEAPTISMLFVPNTSPYAGKEGKIVQPRRIGDRLIREALNNVALQVEVQQGGESFVVKGRGEFQMAILIESMRREGFELAVGRPQIIFKEANGVKQEPIEHLYIDCDETFMGIVTEKLSRRRGKMVNMVNHGSGRVRLEYSIPSRGLIGYRGEFLTDTRGTGIMNSYLAGYEDYRGEIVSRVNGSLVADREGNAVAYALFHLEPRGVLFVEPGELVYSGMVIGEHNREEDLHVNPCKTKKLTNIRSAGRDENIILSPPVRLSLEQAIEFIRDDEMIEITPKSLRVRKIVLPPSKGRE